MSASTDQKEIAKAMFLKGEPDTAIAAAVGIHRNTVAKWRRLGNWESLKAKLPDPTPRRPQLVSFEGSHQKRKPAELPPLPDLGTVAGQLELIDQAIAIAREQIANPSSPQQYAASVSALPKLLDSREKVCPTDRKVLLFQILEKYRDPAELLEHLKQLGFGRKGATGPKVTPISTRL